MGFVYPVANVLERGALRLFADYRVSGRENVPPKGPLIVVANHLSNFDPALMGASIPRRLWFLAKRSIFLNHPAYWFLTAYGAFPLNRAGVDSRAFRWVLNKLEIGESIMIFPEGTRSRSGTMRNALPGVVRLVLKSQAPLLPVGITGTTHLGTWLRCLNPTGRIRVNIGPLFSLPSIEGRPNREVLDSLTDMIMYRIAGLLPEVYQGVYGPTRDEASVAPRSR